MMENKYYSVDLMKFLCAVMVIGVHTNVFMEYSPDLRFAIVHIVARIAVPFFCVSAGYFFTHRIASTANKKDYFLGYLKRLLILYLGWSLVYFVYDFLYILNYQDSPVVFFHSNNVIDAILKYLVLFFFFGSHFHLWYIPALMLAISLLYVAIRYDKVKLFLILAGGFYLIGLSGNSYYGLFRDNPLVGPVYNVYFDIMFTTRNGLLFSFVFVMLGAVIKFHPGKLSRRTNLVLFLICQWLMFVEVYALKCTGILGDVDMYLMMLPAVYFLFRFLLQCNPDIRILKSFDFLYYSIGIYFIHGLFLILFEKLFGMLDITDTNTLAFVLVFACSFGSIWMIRRFKIPILVQLVK